MKELIEIQRELKAPKGQRNNFGNYNYRSCEDILEAVKPLCHKYNCLLTISDDMVMLGDRFYVKATAKIKNSAGETEHTTAYAREAETKKGMDASQITGSSSSYARKYALNGLFDIDDTKDADTMDNRTHQPQNTTVSSGKATGKQKGYLRDYQKTFKEKNIVEAVSYIADALSRDDLTETEATVIINHCKTKLEAL